MVEPGEPVISAASNPLKCAGNGCRAVSTVVFTLALLSVCRLVKVYGACTADREHVCLIMEVGAGWVFGEPDVGTEFCPDRALRRCYSDWWMVQRLGCALTSLPRGARALLDCLPS